MERPVESELLELIRNGDFKAFEVLFRLYYPRPCAYAHFYLPEESDAEDIVQDLFVSLWCRRRDLQIRTSLSAYLQRAVRNRCLNFIRRYKSRRLLRGDETRSEFFSDVCSVESDSLLPSDPLEMCEIENRISLIVQGLPEKCRRVFELSRFEGLDYLQIALKLGISPNTVKVHIFKALTRLREGLSEFLPVFVFFFCLFG